LYHIWAEVIISHFILKYQVNNETSSEFNDLKDDDIKKYMLQMLEQNPIKFVQLALLLIGRDIQKSNATDFEMSQESDLENGKRFLIKVKGTIEEVPSLPLKQ
jgi:hypothetical protein